MVTYRKSPLGAPVDAFPMGLSQTQMYQGARKKRPIDLFGKVEIEPPPFGIFSPSLYFYLFSSVSPMYIFCGLSFIVLRMEIGGFYVVCLLPIKSENINFNNLLIIFIFIPKFYSSKFFILPMFQFKTKDA